MEDYYAVLGVRRNASVLEIKSAFKRLALVWHPDRNPPEKKQEAHERFIRIYEAYAALCDPQKRQQADEYASSSFDSFRQENSGVFDSWMVRLRLGRFIGRKGNFFATCVAGCYLLAALAIGKPGVIIAVCMFLPLPLACVLYADELERSVVSSTALYYIGWTVLLLPLVTTAIAFFKG